MKVTRKWGVALLAVAALGLMVVLAACDDGTYVKTYWDNNVRYIEKIMVKGDTFVAYATPATDSADIEIGRGTWKKEGIFFTATWTSGFTGSMHGTIRNGVAVLAHNNAVYLKKSAVDEEVTIEVVFADTESEAL
jgi:hypothetical protein